MVVSVLCFVSASSAGAAEGRAADPFVQNQKLGWSWAYWQFDSDFVLYDVKNDRWIEWVRDALVGR